MSIVSSDIKFYLTGGVGNTDPNLSLGGDTSSTEVSPTLHGLFDAVSSVEAESGDAEYRAVSIKNTNGAESAINTIAYISQESTGTMDEVAIGYENGIQTVANESTAPAGVAFTTPLTKATGVSLGTIASGGVKRLWVRWTITAGATKMNPTQCRFTISVDTV